MTTETTEVLNEILAKTPLELSDFGQRVLKSWREVPPGVFFAAAVLYITSASLEREIHEELLFLSAIAAIKHRETLK
jgi:hypothetical protein